MKKFLMVILSVLLVFSVFIVPASAATYDTIEVNFISGSAYYDFYSDRSSHKFYALVEDPTSGVVCLYFSGDPYFGTTGQTKIVFSTVSDALDFLNKGSTSNFVSYESDSTSNKNIFNSGLNIIASNTNFVCIAPPSCVPSNNPLPSYLINDKESYEYYTIASNRYYYAIFERPDTGITNIIYSSKSSFGTTGDTVITFPSKTLAFYFLETGIAKNYLSYCSGSSVKPSKYTGDVLVAGNADNYTLKPNFTVLSKLDPSIYTGVLDDLVGVLPIVLVILIGYISIRKAISFLRGLIFNA